MSEAFEGNGSCLCGAVKFNARNALKSIGACHCNSCRKWGGGPLIGVHCGNEVSFLGQENISIYDSSDWAERGFCKRCGSHLFYRLKENMHHFICVGLFEDQSQFVLDRQSYIDRKPSYYSFANNTDDMTEAEMVEKFAKS